MKEDGKCREDGSGGTEEIRLENEVQQDRDDDGGTRRKGQGGAVPGKIYRDIQKGSPVRNAGEKQQHRAEQQQVQVGLCLV